MYHRIIKTFSSVFCQKKPKFELFLDFPVKVIDKNYNLDKKRTVARFAKNVHI